MIISYRDAFGAATNLKIHFAQNLSAYDEFYPSRAFKGLFGLRSDTSKVVFILNKYLNIYCIIISLKDSFGAITRLKNSRHAKTKSFLVVLPKSSH